jgi:hypothetical protein
MSLLLISKYLLHIFALADTVRKMILILSPIKHKVQTQFFMALKFLLRPLRSYDVKPNKIAA